MNEHRPWYREPLVWLIIAFPLTAVIAGIATYIIADRTKDGLVVDDYYKRGKEINLSLARDRKAMELGLSGRLHLDARAQKVALDLTGNRGVELPASVSLQWLHATRSGYDRSQDLVREPDGRYRASLPELAPGRWYAQLEAGDWRLQGELFVPSETRFELRPSPTATRAGN